MNVTPHEAFHLRGGRIIDPWLGRDEVADLAIRDGRIVESPTSDAPTLDASGCIVCPGLMDIHVHLREPGGEHKETIETGTRAAAAGGFTYVTAMPNTNPTADQNETIALVLARAREAGYCEVGPIGAISLGRKGQTLTDLAALNKAGAVAFSDDGDGIENDELMRAAFRAAKALGAVLIQHCEYKAISAGGVMHDGEVSRRLGFPGLGPRSEEAMIERDIALCRETGGRYHVAHISTVGAVDLVREAKAEGLPVTAEVCTHHLVLTDHACAEADPNTKMHPPLRAQKDVSACRKGLADGTIDCIVTDHAPHAPNEKAVGFLAAPPGIIGLETAVPLAAAAMMESGLGDWARVVAWFTKGPAAVLGIDRPTTKVGSAANLTVFDPARRWTVDLDQGYSKSRNTPFAGWELTGQAVATIRGPLVFRRNGGG